MQNGVVMDSFREKEKMLFVYSQDLCSAYGGSRRTNQNLKGLNSNFDCSSYKLSKYQNNKLEYPYIAIGYYPVLHRDYKEIERIIIEESIKYVFLDFSYYGALARYIKKRFPKIKVIVHYHNYEKLFAKQSKSSQLTHIIKTFLIIKNEKLAAKFGDYHVFISPEDYKAVNDDYGLKNNNAVVVPPMLQDNFVFDEAKAIRKRENYVVFMGSSFDANNEAVDFLIKKIAPSLKIKLLVVGKDMKRTFPGVYINTEVIDYVEDLNEILNNAVAFVAPVFSGSGAKIKVAEALMHGKYIIGTKETFTGYDISDADVAVCCSAGEFIDVIDRLPSNKKYYEKNRELFLRKYDIKNNNEAFSMLRAMVECK